MAKNKNQPVEARITVDGHNVTAVPNERSAELDQLLEQRGATTFVFIPLAKLGKKEKSKSLSRGAIARKKKKLPSGSWYDGKLHHLEKDRSVPGVLAFDIRRRTARDIAEKLGVNQFMWGTSSAPVESHDVKIFEDEGEHSWSGARALALVGLSDMAATAGRISTLPTAVEESQTSMDKFWRLVAVVLGAAIAGGAVKAALLALLSVSDSTKWLSMFVSVVFYPFVIPAVLVGIYLRVLMKRGEEQARDFTAAEAEQNWIKVAPHLLVLWVVCWLAVTFLTLLQSVPSTDFFLIGNTSGLTTSFIICVWMLLPIATSDDVESLFKYGFESGFAAAVSIFVIKLSLWVTNLITDAILGALTSLLPFDIPERLQEIISAVINFGAEVFFVAVLLGYAWTRTRQQFMRL